MRRVALFVAGALLLAGCNMQISADPFTNTTSQHRTQVEPDTLSFGSTIVSAFQSGRFFDGGASDIGWATSTDGGSRWTRANAQDHRGGILGGPAIPAAMFSNEFFITKIHRDARAIAIPASEFFGGSRGPIPADEADGNHAASQARLAHFIVVEIEKGLVGIDQRDVLPSVAIIVQHREAPAVRRIIQP